MNTRPSRLLLAATSTAAAAALALTGCSASSSPGGSSATTGGSGKLLVVATTTQVGDFAAEVGGDNIQLTTLLAPGASAHHFDPSPEQLLALGRAKVLVESGAGLEGFIDSAVSASGFGGAVVTAADGVDLAEAKAITAEGGGYVDDDEDEHEHDHDAAESDAEHHDHEPSDLNPHLWTSPTFAQGMVNEIADGLAKADPAHADTYRQRAVAYNAKLGSLNTWIAAQYAKVPEKQRLFVSGHDAMRYYLHDYDIQYVGSLLPSFEDNAEPSAAQIDALIAAIKKDGVKAIFTESSISPKLAETVAKESGATWVSGEDALYVDALGPKGSGADTYLGATEHNTRTILNAWGFTPGPLPADLGSSSTESGS